MTSGRKKIADAVVDNLPGMVFRAVNDGEWTFTYASGGTQTLLGYPPEQVINEKKLKKMVPREDREANKRILDAITRENPHYKAVYRIRVDAGGFKWVREEGTAQFADDGRLVWLDGFLVDITDYKIREEALLEENSHLRSTIQKRCRLDNIIGQSLAMQEMYGIINKAAASRATVVVTGESGTGKELVSRAIHNMGDQHDNPFIVVNCGAISANLLESEFFGYRKGAFSGALTDRQGFLDAASGGTLFLDEIGEISLNLQVKLLRVLDGEGYLPVGETTVKHSHFRLIVATNRNLEDMVRSGDMREDFYYRINALRLRIPPLRERKEDIMILARYFLKKFSETDESPHFTEHEKRLLKTYSWPGNVRELQNVVSRFLIHGTIDLTGDLLRREPEFSLPDTARTVQAFSGFQNTGTPPGTSTPPGMGDPPGIGAAPREAADSAAGFFNRVVPGSLSSDMATDMAASMEQVEKKMLCTALDEHRWHIGNAAAALGFSRRTMQRRMKKYGLKK